MRALLPTLLWLLSGCGAERADREASEATVAEPNPVAADPVSASGPLVLEAAGFAPDDDLERLRQRFGADQVLETEVEVGAGETERGAVLFPSDPARRIYVYFADAASGRGLAAVYVRDTPSRWQTADGITTGLSLDRLAALNGAPVAFTGFDWDYGGRVTHGRGGRIDDPIGADGHLLLELGYTLAEGQVLPADYPAGDAEFDSDHLALRQVPPQVVAFGIGYAQGRRSN
jgi:hypothetical protein